MVWLLSSLLVLAGSFASAELPKKKIILSGKTLTVEIARTQEEQSKGLMYRRSLPENHGMLFIYKEERVLHFWMKNTFIPLSIGYFDKSRRLLEVQDMEASVSVLQAQVSRSTSSAPAQYALEVNRGWFKENKVQPGQKFRFLNSD